METHRFDCSRRLLWTIVAGQQKKSDGTRLSVDKAQKSRHINEDANSSNHGAFIVDSRVSLQRQLHSIGPSQRIILG